MSAHSKVKGLNEFLKSKRRSAGLTQMEASLALGHTSPQYVSNFERCLCEPSLETAVKLCEFYGVSNQELYEVMVELFEADLESRLFRTGKT